MENRASRGWAAESSVAALVIFCLSLIVAPVSLRGQSTVGQVRTMKLIAPRIGWALVQQRLYRTENDGKNWSNITPPGPANQCIDGVFFLDSSRGWVVLSDGLPQDTTGFTLRLATTQDAGSSWTIQKIAPSVDPNLAGDYSGEASVFFLDAQHGWMMLRLMSSSNFSRGMLLTTADGGQTWSLLPYPPAANSVYFVTPTDGWIAGGPSGDQLWVTRNGGRSWKQQYVPLLGPCPKCRIIYAPPTFQNASDGVLPVTILERDQSLVGTYVTHDGGTSWIVSKAYKKPGRGNRIAASVVGTHVIRVFATSIGQIGVRLEGKVTSSSLPPALWPMGSITHVDFTDESHGWMLYSAGKCLEFKSHCSQQYELLSTQDGGKTFTVITPTTPATSPGKSGNPSKIKGHSSYTSQAAFTSAITSAKATSGMSNAITQSTSQTSDPSGTMISQEEGFDQSCVGTESDMQTWWDYSPYYDTGVYLGGDNVSCKSNTYLNATWVSQTSGMGWGMMPLWVGPQASCIANASSFNLISTDPTTAYGQGVSQADLAVSAASGFGISDSVIYYDMEYYPSDGSTCSNAVISFLEGWVSELHSNNFTAGLYGSISDFETDFINIVPLPDAAWIAAWNDVDSVLNIGSLSNTYWSNNQRIHQFCSDGTTYPCTTYGDSFGGITYSIDGDIEDAPVVSWSGARLLAAPTLLKPANGATGLSTTPAFTWTTIDGAASYRILVATTLAALPTDPAVSTCTGGCVINATPSGASFAATASDGLQTGTTYYWEVHARGDKYGTWSSAFSFTVGSSTSTSAPTVSTTGSSAVTSSAATLGGSVNPNGLDTTVWFEYGTDSNLATSTSTLTQDIGSGTSTVPYSFNLSNLAAGTTYYFRAEASNSVGTSQGSILQFTTSVVLVPIVSLSPTSLSFGNQLTGQASAAKTVTLSNTGAAALSITSIAVTGTDSGDFSQSNSCGTSLAAGTACPISVTFKPTSTGSLTAALTISDNASNSPQTVSLGGAGVAPAASLSSTSLTFGSEVVGQTAAAQTVTVTDSGTASLNFSNLAITGEFDLSASGTTCSTSTSLGVGASCAVAVTFTPTTIGSLNGTLTLTDDAGTQQITLNGTGTSAGATLLPSSLTFGSQVVGTASVEQTTNLTNTGTADLTLTGISITGDFTQTNNCGALPATIAPNASCAINVTFDPTATGTRNGTVAVTDNASGGEQIVALEGTGTAPGASLSPSSLTFGNQPVGTSSTAQSVTLTNTGTSSLNISQITSSGDFAQTNTCASSLAVGATCTISVTFAPTALGIRTGTVSVTDGAAGSPQIVSLTGTGITSSVSLSPTNLSFGNVAVGTTSAPQDVTLTNSGTTSLGISNISISGANSGDFAIGTGSNCSISKPVAAGTSCTIAISFTPLASGVRTANLTVTDSATSGTQTVALSGAGSTSTVSLSPSTLNFPDQPVGTSSATQAVTLSNIGTAPLAISSISTSGDFQETNNCGSQVAVGAQCDINVAFTPTASGSRTGTLSITDNAAGSPQTVTLTGTGTSAVATLSAASETFPGEVVNTASPQQSLTLKNTGSAALTIAGISVGGTNAGDFAQTNNCGSSVAAGASCAINITFKPTAAGARTGALSISDNATGSPQTVALSGTGEDFTLGVASGGSSTDTVTAGSTATYSLGVAPEGGFNQTVSISCTGAPSLATCIASPSSVTPDGTNPAAVSVTVSTTAASAVPPSPSPVVPLGGARFFLPALGLLLLVLLGIFAPRPRRRAWLTLALTLALIGVSAACGGGGPSSTTSTGGGSHTAGTPTGTYTLTVSGSDGSLTHSTTLTLTVQ